MAEKKKVKLSRQQITSFMEQLNTDIIHPDNTRPQGPNDKTPPHAVISAAVTREVHKSLRSIEDRPELVLTIANQRIEAWNHYLTFAFGRKKSTHEYFTEHKSDIQQVVDYCQKGTLKNQMDRQLIWRFKQIPRVKSKVPVPSNNGHGDMVLTPLAEDYLDTAIGHNAGFILGTVGHALSKRIGVDDLESSYFCANIIAIMKQRIEEGYDPCQAALSTYMTKPIQWAVDKEIKGKAQDRFDRKMKHGVGGIGGSEEDAIGMTAFEALTPDERSGADSFVFMDPALQNRLMQRLRDAGAKLQGSRAQEVYAYKLEHPFAILQEVGDAIGCTKENVRQGLDDIARQMERIDPELTSYVRAMLRNDAGSMDDDRLDMQYQPNRLQNEIRALLPAIESDYQALRQRIGEDNIRKSADGLCVSRVATRHDPSLRHAELELNADKSALESLEAILHSPYVDAGFDILGVRQLQALAFYAGTSETVCAFVEDHIEEIACAIRAKTGCDGAKRPGREDTLRKFADRFYDATPDDLAKFSKHDLNMLLSATESSLGDVLDRDDLLLIRETAVNNLRQRDVQRR